MPLTWIVFDYGEVISERTRAVPHMAQRLGVAPDKLEPVYFDERASYDRGESDQEYWRVIAERLGVAMDPELASELTEIDIAGWSHTNSDTVRLIEQLRATDLSLAVLSNAASSFGRATEREPWTNAFEHLLFSGDLRLAKPDPEIYHLLLRQLNAAPHECLFFDDRQDNVDAARAQGMHAQRWQGAEPARALLREFAVLP